MTIRPGRMRRKLRAGERVYGVTIQLASPDIVELSGAAGYDYAWIDAEHGAFSLSEIRDLIRAADAVDMDSIVRVPNHEPSYIQRVMDLGAAGIMVPHVRTVQEAEALVAAASYSPGGIRGACPFIRSVNHVSLDWRADYTAADEDVIVFGLIEDIDGIESVEEIAAVPGLTGLVFGPFDLGMALGLHGDVAHPQLREMHDRLVDACHTVGIHYVTAGIDWEFGAFPNTRSRIVTVAGDRGNIFAAFSRSLADAQALAAEHAEV